jgi:deoxyribonuclease-4
MLLGAHVSIAGGYMNALVEAKRLKIDAIQIFTKNQRMWQERLVTEDEGKVFRAAMKKYGVKQAFSHAIYLIGLASESEEIVEKSVLSLAAELERCRALGLTHTVMHPGGTKYFPFQEALTRVGNSIKRVLKAGAKNPVKLLLENTASAGLGVKIENLAELFHYIRSPRVGICIDTCHAFAAGYDIRTTKQLENFFKTFDKEIGLENLLCFHLNDSKGALGSKIDRHANIGEGHLGLLPFEYIMKNFPHIPKVIETPKENEADEKNLHLLRKLFKKK